MTNANLCFKGFENGLDHIDDAKETMKTTKRSSFQKIAILTGGGDCPGLNTVIRAVAAIRLVPPDGELVQTARALGISFGNEKI